MQNIQAAFARSSQALLHLLQHDLGLNNTLAALKHYFLLDKGDMLLSFLDTAEEELSKPASEVSVIRLQSLLDLGMDCAAASISTIVMCADSHAICHKRAGSSHQTWPFLWFITALNELSQANFPKLLSHCLSTPPPPLDKSQRQEIDCLIDRQRSCQLTIPC